MYQVVILCLPVGGVCWEVDMMGVWIGQMGFGFSVIVPDIPRFSSKNILLNYTLED